jgi:serine/threonine protein kinase
VAATMLTEQGMIFGTPATMAPEQALGEETDHRADLYAVAVMLFQLLAGRLPFESASASALLVMHVSSPPPPLAELAPHLAGSGLPELVERGLAKARDDRFQSAAELLAALDRCALRPLPPPGDTLPSILHDLRGAAPPPPTQPSGALTPAPAPAPPDRAHRRAAILLLVLAAALVGLALLGSARDAL